MDESYDKEIQVQRAVFCLSVAVHYARRIVHRHFDGLWDLAKRGMF